MWLFVAKCKDAMIQKTGICNYRINNLQHTQSCLADNSCGFCFCKMQLLETGYLHYSWDYRDFWIFPQKLNVCNEFSKFRDYENGICIISGLQSCHISRILYFYISHIWLFGEVWRWAGCVGGERISAALVGSPRGAQTSQPQQPK